MLTHISETYPPLLPTEWKPPSPNSPCQMLGLSVLIKPIPSPHRPPPAFFFLLRIITYLPTYLPTCLYHHKQTGSNPIQTFHCCGLACLLGRAGIANSLWCKWLAVINIKLVIRFTTYIQCTEGSGGSWNSSMSEGKTTVCVSRPFFVLGIWGGKWRWGKAVVSAQGVVVMERFKFS